MNSIKEMVKYKTVRFLYYKDANLFYSTECNFIFPVPISDVGTASMNAEDKAILFMYWIRKEIEVVDKNNQLQYISEMDEKGYTTEYCDY